MDYRAPELVEGGPIGYNHNVDLWSCTSVLFFLLSEQHAFQGDGEEETSKNILEGKFKEMEGEKWEKVSEETKKVIRESFEKRFFVTDEIFS